MKRSSQSPFGSSHDLDRARPEGSPNGHIVCHNRLSARVTIWTPVLEWMDALSPESHNRLSARVTIWTESTGMQNELPVTMKSQSPFGSSHDLDKSAEVNMPVSERDSHNRLSARVTIWTWCQGGVCTPTPSSVTIAFRLESRFGQYGLWRIYPLGP